MGIYPNYKSIKGICITNKNNDKIIYEYNSNNILTKEDILQAKDLYDSLDNKKDISIQIFVTISSTYDINSVPFYDWYPINSFNILI